MKRKLIELDVDFIGGQSPLTREEELAISKFIRGDEEKRRELVLENKNKCGSKTQEPA